MGNKTRRRIFIGSVVTWLAIGTVFYHFVEHWTYATSFYFSAVSLTTVGYGDLYPTTEFSRLFTAFYVLGGTAIVVAALGIIGAEMLEKRVEKKTSHTP